MQSPYFMHTICDKPRLQNLSVKSSQSMPGWKRLIDISCCLLALPFLAVCTLLMTIMTKFVSPGPVFFRQERIGFLGRRFRIYKFRTMTVGADTSTHQAYFKDLIGSNAPMMKMDARGDARLVPGGWLLRASGLDELPQLINVLRGDMSIVGPRPCIPTEFDNYLPWQQQRVDAVPGLTGLWQVSGKNRTTFEEMIRFDIKYAQSISLRLDLKIIFMTVPSLVQQIYDTRIGRRKAAVENNHTTAPMAPPLRASAGSRSPF
jgi:lipopolysaccharide/colanic/teichoic acid biosynthesis glycosyltransferase